MDQRDSLEILMKEPSIYRDVSIVRLQMIKESQSLYGMNRFTNPEEAVETVKPLFALCDREIVAVMSVDTKCTPLAVEVASVGGLDACMIDPRIIFKHALLSNAAAVICFHNHPSGEPKPSMEDGKVTERLCKAGKLLGVNLLDHIIIGDGTYYSFRQNGMMGKPYVDLGWEGKGA